MMRYGSCLPLCFVPPGILAIPTHAWTNKIIEKANSKSDVWLFSQLKYVGYFHACFTLIFSMNDIVLDVRL